MNCHFSRFVIAVPLMVADATLIANAFIDNVILRYNTPRVLLTDNGQNLNRSEVLTALNKQLAIRAITTSPYSPPRTGWPNVVIPPSWYILNHYVTRKADWDRHLPDAVSAYNTYVTQLPNTLRFSWFTHSTIRPHLIVLLIRRSVIAKLQLLLNNVFCKSRSPERWSRNILMLRMRLFEGAQWVQVFQAWSTRNDEKPWC